MATEARTARPGSVAMETTRELGLRSPGASPAQNPAEPLSEAGAAVAAARWDLRKYSLLIVIGDIGTESQLRAVRAHLEQGEPLSWLSRSTPSVPFRHLHSSPSAHFCSLHFYVHFSRPVPLSPACLPCICVLSSCQHLACPFFPKTPCRSAVSRSSKSSGQTLESLWSHPFPAVPRPDVGKSSPDPEKPMSLPYSFFFRGAF